MRRTRAVALAGLILVPVLAGGFIYQERTARDGAMLFDQVMTLVSQRFVDTVDAGALYEKAARGLLVELEDPYSELYTPEQLKQFEQSTGGRYGGLGMQIEPVPGRGITVSKVFPNTPAEQNGIIEGDVIMQIDDSLNARDWTSDRVSRTLTGTPGTQVRVSFARPGVQQPITVDFTRAVIHIPAVLYALKLEDRIGYIRLQGFNETAAEEVAASIQQLTAEGSEGLILDLRENPGGYLQQALTISNLFLPQGREIASVRGRGTPPETYVSRDRPLAPDLPLVILIDQRSASASEIVAGALQDHDRAVVVGETSFGKGLVQTLFPLDGGYAVKLTTAKWFTPVGRSIQKERTLTDDGRWVEVYPDSLPTDSLLQIRPTYRSTGGRVVYGGGAITPDEVVHSDTLTTAEQTLGRMLAPSSSDLIQSIAQIAYEEAQSGGPIASQQELRQQLYDKLQERGVRIDDEVWNEGASYVDRLVLRAVLRRAGGDSAEFLRFAPEDVQLQRAIAYLRNSDTQRDVFALVPTSEEPGR